MGAPSARAAPTPARRLGVAHPDRGQIGERMFISPETVKTHLGHTYKKLDIHSRAELSALAVRRNTTNDLATHKLTRGSRAK
jgi:Bacterial regulatory proteins, luxR family